MSGNLNISVGLKIFFGPSVIILLVSAFVLSGCSLALDETGPAERRKNTASVLAEEKQDATVDDRRPRPSDKGDAELGAPFPNLASIPDHPRKKPASGPVGDIDQRRPSP